MRIFDCFLYNGEIETLEIRLNELADAVDVIVVVEATRTFSGLPKPLRLREQWARVRPYAAKIRYVVIADDVTDAEPGADAWARERFQRNGITRGLIDARRDDLILISDVDEIPRASTIQSIRTRAANAPGRAYGLVLTLSYFALNYVHDHGPETDLITAIAVPQAMLAPSSSEMLRHGLRNGSIPSERIADAGWHFSYLSDVDGIRAKIRAFSHQEYNTEAFLGDLDVRATIADRRDLFGRDAYSWTISGEERLPAHVRANRDRYAHLILTQQATFVGPPPAPRPLPVREPPVILCPYLAEQDRARVGAAFGLDEPRGCDLPFHFWHDRERIGPERAYQRAWEAFPTRDVIIVHTDMRPLPEDTTNAWYDRLVAAAEALPDAGLIGCDLLFPLRAPEGEWYVQCAGGWIRDGTFGHIGGHVDLPAGTASPEAFRYDARFAAPRRTDWVTFGGVYFRRETIDMVGGFDPFYRWAYVMDVDWSLEATIRGARLYQVPVNLLHEENGSTRAMLADEARSADVRFNYARLHEKWRWLLDRPSAVAVPATWQQRRQAAFLSAAEAGGVPFAAQAYARNLAPPGAVDLECVRAAYRLILDREIDPGAATAWDEMIANRPVDAVELATSLCDSPEYATLVARARQA